MDVLKASANARYERRVYYPPRLKKIVVALLCLAFGVASLLALLTGVAASSEQGTYILVGIFVFFLGCGGLIIFRLVKRQPVVVMDTNGLTVWLASRRPEHIGWERITDLHVLPGPRMQVLAITHRPPHSHWTDRATFWRRRGAQNHFGIANTAIPSVSVSTPLRKVEAEIRRRVPL